MLVAGQKLSFLSLQEKRERKERIMG